MRTNAGGVRLVGDKEEEMMVWEPGCAAAGDSLLQLRSMQRGFDERGAIILSSANTVMHPVPP